MSLIRALFFNRIGGQIALLILLSLVALHAIVITGIYLSHRADNRPMPDERPAQFVSSVKLIAAATPDERGRLLAQVNQAFPQLRMMPAAVMPTEGGATQSDPPLDFLARALGPEFKLTAMAPNNATTIIGVAVRLPDGDVLTASLPSFPWPPPLGGPIVFTILFVVISLTLLGLWATRALRRPLTGFAEAAEDFDLDGDIAALPERGPEEIRAVAKAFNRMRDRIRSLVDDRTRMLAAMGHDLRTPITRLRLRSEFIGDKELRDQMLHDLDQMRTMTDSVLSFLRDGQAREDLTAVDVATVLQTICDEFCDFGHDVIYQGPDHVTLNARPGELQRAVANLVDNAVRHGAHTVVHLTHASGALRIEVEDDGSGIADAQKSAMLEAFVRGDARSMNDRAGFGLGLAIARAITEAHGGTLSLHDRAPHGLIARIALPAADPVAHDIATDRASPPHNTYD